MDSPGKSTPEDLQLWEEASEEQACLTPVSRKSPGRHLHPFQTRWLVGSMASTPTLQPGEISGYLEWVVLGLQLSSQLQLGTPGKEWAESLEENGHCLKQL